MYKDDKSNTSGEFTSDVTKSVSTINSECSSQDEGGSTRGLLPVLRKASKIYYVVGTLITQPNSDPSDEHVRWFTEAYNLEEVSQESDKFDIFQAVLDQCEIPNVCASDLSDFMIDFIMKQRDIIEPVITINLKALSLNFGKICEVDGKGENEWVRCNIEVYLHDVA